jgi:hypothetical protein
MGFGNCCDQGVGEYRILGYTGSCSLNWDILNIGDNRKQNPEIDFPLDDSHPDGPYNSKFHSDGFNMNEDENVGIFGYDIMSEKGGRYVYVASGDLGVQVFKNENGTLVLERTIQTELGLASRSSDESLAGGLVIGGNKGSLYGYELSPFHGAYSLCSSKKSRKIYVAVGQGGLYYVDTETGNSSRVRDAVDLDPNNPKSTIFNKVVRHKEFLFIGTTGYAKPANEGLWHQFDQNYNNYPDDIDPLGVEVLRIDEFETLEGGVPILPTSPNSLVFKTALAGVTGGRDFGINDIYLMDGDIDGSGDYSIYIAMGRTYSKESTSQDMEYEGGALRYIASRPIIDDTENPQEHGKRDYVHVHNSHNFIANGSTEYKQPIKSITADGEKIYLTTGTRYSKNAPTGSHFSGVHDFGDGNEESCTFNNDLNITEIIPDKPGIPKSIHNCGDLGLLGGFLSWVYSSVRNTYGMMSFNLSLINDLNITADNTECFVSDVRRFENQKVHVACWKGLGMTIKEDGFDKKTFTGLTNKKGTSCSGWISASTIPNFFRTNPSVGYDNFEYTWSPIKSCASGRYIYFLDSLQTAGNESGPGYFITWNEDKEDAQNPLGWQSKPTIHQSKIGGVITIKKENF